MEGNQAALFAPASRDDIDRWGRTILRSKTALIKPFSKVKRVLWIDLDERGFILLSLV